MWQLFLGMAQRLPENFINGCVSAMYCWNFYKKVLKKEVVPLKLSENQYTRLTEADKSENIGQIAQNSFLGEP